MKELKEFIDNLPSDKKSHVVLGLFLNPFAILISTILTDIILNNIYVSYTLSLLPCAFVHWGIEYWQKKTGKGHYDNFDAIAGISSGVVIWFVGIILITIS